MILRSTVPPQGPIGIGVALGVLGCIIGLSCLAAWGVSMLTPGAPAYFLLIYAAVALVPLMVIGIRVFPWVVHWYYLMPAIVFLGAFTLYPIALTIGFAFTNYSSVNSGAPDSASRMDIVKLDPTRTVIELGTLTDEAKDLKQAFACDEASCSGRRIAFYTEDAAQPEYATIERAENKSITLVSPLSENKFVSVTPVNEIRAIGIENFRSIFAKASAQLWPVFGWTVVFALSTILINTFAGLVLGLLLANRRLKFRNIYRSLLFLPWAVPAVISVQMWAALFNQSSGSVNRLIGLLGAAPIPWLEDPLWAKMAILLVNLWLGFPYMMTATISSLASIPEDLYEAASIDGASRFQQITAITLPLLRDAFTPILLSGFAFNFNNFGIIYLLTAGKPPMEGGTSTAQSTDILISWGYNTAFTSAGGAQYGLASAIAVIIAVLTMAISVVNFRVAGVFKEAKR